MGIFRKRYSPPGTPPGTLIPERVSKAKITLISYSPEEYEELETESVEECFKYVGRRDVTWLDVEGARDVGTLKDIGERLGFHPLTLEDVVNLGQRPKVEDFGDYAFIILRAPRTPTEGASIDLDQISIFIGPNFVVTVQDKREIFEPIRRRIRENRGRIRRMKADYLAYALIDLVVDLFFPVMESMGNRIESLEDDLLENPSIEAVREMREIKRSLILIRTSIWPTREVINGLMRGGSKLMSDEVRLYLRDVYDHTVQIADILESYRDLLSEMFNLYLSEQANKTNEIMKLLTIIATIFIPLTFIAGIYGMNFEFMPELKWKPAYFVTLGVMIIIALGMLWLFRKRRWI